MKLYLVRHGESVGNVSDIIQGQLNVDLTENGYGQAQKIAQRLKDYTFDYIFSSDLRRAYNTAEAIAQNHHNEIIIDKRLKERNLGDAQGMLKSRQSQEEIEEYKTNPNFKFLNGESPNELLKRLKPFHDELFQDEKYKEKSILIVAHSGIMKALLTLLHQKDEIEKMEEMSIWKTKNTALYEIDVVDPKNPKILTNNCTKHLE